MKENSLDVIDRIYLNQLELKKWENVTQGKGKPKRINELREQITKDQKLLEELKKLEGWE